MVQEVLEAVTWPGEALLGFAVCRHNPGEFFDKSFLIGLTQRRFLLVRKDQPERVYTIYRSLIDRVVMTGPGLLKRPGIAIHLGGDVIRLEIAASWGERAARMVEEHCAWDDESPYLTADQFLDSISDLAGLGLLRPAQALLRKHRAEDPVLEIEPRAEHLDYDLTQGRWSLSLTLIMLAIVLVFLAGRLGLGRVWSGGNLLPMALTLLAGVELVRRQQTWRKLALGFALLAAILNLAYCGVSGLWLNVLMWTAFGAASITALTGKTSRPRNLIATGIFSLGFLVPMVFTVAALITPDEIHFSDDFSADKGWVDYQTETLTSRMENGAYTLHVQENSVTYFAFPPVGFNPHKVQFDALVPGAFSGEIGTYGVACGFQEEGPVYLVEIDPVGKHYSFLRQEGERSVPLGEGYWNPLSGTQTADGAAHLEVACGAGQMTLTMNGVLQGQARMGDFEPDGKMGLFVHTWPETGPDGYKVLFDNIVFTTGQAR